MKPYKDRYILNYLKVKWEMCFKIKRKSFQCPYEDISCEHVDTSGISKTVSCCDCSHFHNGVRLTGGITWKKHHLVITVLGMLVAAMLYFLTCFVIHSAQRYPKVGDILILVNGELYYDSPNSSLALHSDSVVVLGIVNNSQDSGFITTFGTVRGINTKDIKPLLKSYEQIVKDNKYHNFESLARCYNNSGSVIPSGSVVEYVKSDKDCPGIRIAKAIDFELPEDLFPDNALEETHSKYGIATTDIEVGSYGIIRLIKNEI